MRYSGYKRLYDSMNNLVRAVGKETVVVIDLAQRIPQTREYMYDSIHFTEKGSMEAAPIIATKLRESVLSYRSQFDLGMLSEKR